MSAMVPKGLKATAPSLSTTPAIMCTEITANQEGEGKGGGWGARGESEQVREKHLLG